MPQILILHMVVVLNVVSILIVRNLQPVKRAELEDVAMKAIVDPGVQVMQIVLLVFVLEIVMLADVVKRDVPHNVLTMMIAKVAQKLVPFADWVDVLMVANVVIIVWAQQIAMGEAV